MKSKQSSNGWPESTAGTKLTRREFVSRVTAAALGAGHLLNSVAGSAPGKGSNSMKYRELGKTGISVSEIGFGSHVSRQNMNDPQERAKQIRKGLDLGINLFDIYDHNYRQFAPMREILSSVRQEVVISLVSTSRPTKEVEYALKALNTEVIDLFRMYLSSKESKEALEVRFGALQQAKKQGKVRAVGIVGHDQTKLLQLLRIFPEVDYLMFPYNFRHKKLSPLSPVEPASPARKRDAEMRDCILVPCADPEFAGLVKDTGVGLIAMKPFGGGGLLKLKPSDPWLHNQQETHFSLPQAALKFILGAPQISSTIPAMNSMAEVEENVEALQGKGLSENEARCLQLYNEAAEQSEGEYLPQDYRWLEQWKV
jgi:aryl-alcohol dehydrogenase-like predicted oxidoreductase